MNSRDITAETFNEIQNMSTKMLPSHKPVEINKEEKESSCSNLKHNCNSVMTSKLPTYFCFGIYVLICLLGNVVTGIIWLKHHQLFVDNQQGNVTLGNETRFRFVWNDKVTTTKINRSKLEVLDKKTKGEEILNILAFLTTNESIGNRTKVSLY